MKHFKRILNYVLVGIFFVFCALVIVVYASGYKIDLTGREITATALIEVQTNDKDASIYLNEKYVGTDREIIRNLPEGQYRLSVKKPGVHEWTKNLTIKGGEAVIFNNIVLFKINPGVEKSDFAIEGDTLSRLADTNNLMSKDGEIFQNDIFVTRVSGDITGLSWYPNLQYIAFTNKGKLKIVEKDGTNQIELFDKSSTSSPIFVNSGKTVIFEDNGVIYRSEIR